MVTLVYSQVCEGGVLCTYKKKKCFCLFFYFQSKHVGGCALFVLTPSNYLLHKASSYHIDVHCPLDVVLDSPIFVLRLHTCRVETYSPL